jgi:hypothetical protein
MVVDSTPAVTGQLRWNSTDFATVENLLLREQATGQEYGDLLIIHVHGWLTQWGVLQALQEEAGELTGPEDDPATELVRQAASLAQLLPAVEVERPEVPELTDDLLEDVRRVCGLTYAQLARVFGISERAVAGWRASGVPRHRATVLQALRAIGLALVGGLGVQGVARWLSDGSPSRLDRIAQGEEQDVAQEARRYEYR